MAHRVFFDLDGDWGDMERNGEFIEADTLAELIPKVQAQLEVEGLTVDMSADELADALEEHGYALDPV